MINATVEVRMTRELIVAEVGYEGELLFDKTKPDGTPKKLMDSSKINNLGWKAKIGIKDGIINTIKEFRDKLS